MNKNPVTKIHLIAGILNALMKLVIAKLALNGFVILSLLVSGNIAKTRIMFIAQNIVATQRGNVLELAIQEGNAFAKKLTTDKSPNLPPKYGPIIKPRPNAAPTSPKFFALLSGVDISAIAD